MQHKFSTRSLTAAALCTFLVLGAGACGKVSEKVGEKAAEKAVESATGADVDASEDGVTIKTKDGEYSSKSTKELPDNWPSDILPVAEGYKVENVTETKTAEGTMSIISTRGEGDPSALVDLYADAMESNGVEVGMQTKSGDGGLVSGTSGATSYQAMIGGDSDGTVSVTLSVTVTDAQSE